MMQVSEINALLATLETTVNTFAGVFAESAVVALCERDVLEVLPNIFDDGSSINYMWTHFENHIKMLIANKK